MEGSLAIGPPSRDHDGENFPVASRLLPAAIRPKVLAFYRFVRTADDIADATGLAPEAKLHRLDALEAMAGDSLAEVGTEEARAMLGAFRQDAVQRRYADWVELEHYCARSAAPVGRLLLRLHAEDSPESDAASDALCAALQILNHLQDLVPDREGLDRIYLPVPWLAEAGGEAAFFDPANTQRRAVLDAALDRVEALLESAAALPRLLRSRLRLQAAVTLGLAWRLLGRLRAGDPVQGRVALTKADFAAAFARLPLGAPSDAAIARGRVSRSGSSFTRGMAVLKGERRRALFAVYAFCRAVDDIADAAMPEGEKRRFLAEWQRKLDRPDCALSRELAWAREAFALPRGECEAMIAGMQTDAAARLRITDAAALDLYCRRVAGSVGAMAVRIFGAPEAEGFGLRLGWTFQLVNILRDAEEDATRDRVYVPSSLLARHGVTTEEAGAILTLPGFAQACAELARQAREGFITAEAELLRHDSRALKPARVMMWGYRRLLDRMLSQGFPLRSRPRLTRAERLHMAFLALGP
jgi:phytoene/squalene synthetase